LYWLLAIMSFVGPLFSSPAASVSGGDSQDSPRVDPDIAAQFKRQSAANQKKITLSVKNNIELQSLVISTIDKYNSGGLSADGHIQNLANIITPKKRGRPAPDSEDVITVLDGDKQIGRQNASYAGWGRARKEECLCLCSAGDVRKVWLLGLPLERLNELMERAFSLRCTGALLDRVGEFKQTRNELYDSMKTMYIENGRPLVGLDRYVHDGAIDYGSGLGQYSLTVQGDGDARIVAVYCKAIDATKNITIDVASDIGPFTIKSNWSMKGAFISSPSETWQCSYFFPSLGRTLKRRRSAGDGVLGVPAFGGAVCAAPANLGRAPPAPVPAAGARPVGPVAAAAVQELPAATLVRDGEDEIPEEED
jgi:hypothetical protein